MLDVLVIGGGPAGLQAALTLARGQRQVLVVDAGPPRNARSAHLNNFVTRDGTSPDTFRALAHQELAGYGVEIRFDRAHAIAGRIGGFTVRLEGGDVRARRVLLAVGMVDELPDLPGLAELWGDTVFQCPYCDGHEVRGQRWAVYAPIPAMLEMTMVARGWTEDVVALTDGRFPVDADLRARLATAGVRVDERAVTALRAGDSPGRLGAVAFVEGAPLERDALILRPPQRQTALVQALGLVTDPTGYLVLDAGQTSRPGIYAAGDLSTPMQSAITSAAAGAVAAAMLNHALTAQQIGWH